jgi:acetoin utilization deacetylase AcuC-like enzyme
MDMPVPETGGRVGLILDPRFEEHDTGPTHAERPERLSSLRRALAGSGVDARCERQPLVSAEEELLIRVHDEAYVRHVERTCSAGRQVLDSMDTAVCPKSEAVARVAAGSLAAMARAVARGALDRGFAAVRPGITRSATSPWASVSTTTWPSLPAC